MGLLSEPQAGAAAAPTGEAPGGEASGMLGQIEKNIESKLNPDLKQAYLSIIVAGRQMMFSEKTHPMMEEYLGKIQGPQDVPKIVAHGIVKLLAILFDRSKKKMSIPASAPAAIALMTYALKYVDGQLNIEVTKPMIDATTTATITGLFALWKVSPQQIQDAITQGGKGASDPAASAPVPETVEAEEV